MRKKLESSRAARRQAARPVFEVRVGDRFVRWVGVARARRWCQDRELVARVIPARAATTRAVPAQVVLARMSATGSSGDDTVVETASMGDLAVGPAEDDRLGRPCSHGDEASLPACGVLEAGWIGRASSRDNPDALAPPCGVFGEDWIVLARVEGPRLPITSVAGLARQLRRALMSFADQPVAEVISGHLPDGAAVETPHLAVVPLPAVTGPHPDGRLLGIALVLPRALDPAARAAVMRAIARFEERRGTGGTGGASGPSDGAPAIPLLLGDAGVLVLQRPPTGAQLPAVLQPATWIGPARHWVSATPIALDRHPGDLHAADPARQREAREAAAACVREAAHRIGLPAPAEIDVLRSRTLPGTAEPRQYPRFPVAQRRPQRVLVHARLRFDEPVRGPVLVGAGRYQGLGLLLPDNSGD
ncbi:MAG TPA: type I-U CRISPR-associated protein Csb2 [Kofleriaceae bacterium]|nr:type I-U CRISPR-associated protein Csb2 [Kofleriaceae bacterium]